MTKTSDLNRRDFLKASAVTSGLLFGFELRFDGRMAAAATSGDPKETSLHAFIEVNTSDRVTILVGKSEMGQGIYTSIPAILADELGARWDQVRIEQALPSPAFRNPGRGTMITGGSTSIRENWDTLRNAGAAVREMLITAASNRWGVKPSECWAENGLVRGPDKYLATFGSLAIDAGKLTPPASPTPKSADKYTLIGTAVPRRDTPAKVEGKAQYGIDVKVPGMVYAAVRNAPVFGADVANLDEVSKVPDGILAIEAVPNGVAAVAETWWPAKKAVEALKLKFTKTDADGLDSDGMTERFRKALGGKGATAHTEGDLEAGLAGAKRVLDAEYEVPFLAHATMEPQNCTARVEKDGADVWIGSQAQEIVQGVTAQLTGLPMDKIRVHTPFLGGGFGRRFESDLVVQAVTLSKKLGRPVKVLWTREEDMQHDFYRPASLVQFRAGIDGEGKPVAWQNKVASPSIMSRVAPPMVKDGLDTVSVEGAFNLPYDLGAVKVDYFMENSHVPVGFWRSVGHSQNAFGVECFLDELAHAAGKDPYEYRRGLLSRSPRHRAVLDLAAKEAGWGEPLPKGRHRGIAVHESFGSYVAQVAEVSVDKAGDPRVHRVVCAIDCGQVTNPNTVEAQMDSAITFGLSAALFGTITLLDGQVEQSNFHDYMILRMNEMPKVEVHIVPSTEAPGGVGEPGTPPIAPAVANALFAATGKRLRKLPLVE